MEINKGFGLVLLLRTKGKKKHFSGGGIILFPPGNHMKFIYFYLRKLETESTFLGKSRICGKNAESQYTRKKRELKVIGN